MSVVGAIEPRNLEGAGERWSAATRIAFRFCFTYFGLYSLCGMFQAVIPIPKVDVPDPGTLWPFRQIIFWVGAHVFGVGPPLVYSGSGSGDKTFDWAELLCVQIAAVIVTLVWTLLDRNRLDYVALHKWFRFYLRFCLAAILLVYAFAKFIPLQMPFPGLVTLLEPYGNFSLMAVLWNSVGASPAYEIFAGLAELLGAVLLMSPRTMTLGALVCALDMFQVFMLNMTYDIPVKQFSFHLLAISVFLLAPQIGRLKGFFVGSQPVALKRDKPLFRSERANRVAMIVQVVWWAWILGMNAYSARKGWYESGPGRPKPPLYGIWDVMPNPDEKAREPKAADSVRVRRIVFDYPNSMAVQHGNDEIEFFTATVNIQKMTIATSGGRDKTREGLLAISRPAADQMVLKGMFNGRNTELLLKREDENRFLLRSRGFNWIQENPYNR